MESMPCSDRPWLSNYSRNSQQWLAHLHDQTIYSIATKTRFAKGSADQWHRQEFILAGKGRGLTSQAPRLWCRDPLTSWLGCLGERRRKLLQRGPPSRKWVSVQLELKNTSGDNKLSFVPRNTLPYWQNHGPRQDTWCFGGEGGFSPH